MPKQSLIMDNLEQTILANFWRCLRDDLTGCGCTSDSLPNPYRRLPYSERAMIERDMLQKDALVFLNTNEFDIWARASNIEPQYMRRMLMEEYNDNSQR